MSGYIRLFYVGNHGFGLEDSTEVVMEYLDRFPKTKPGTRLIVSGLLHRVAAHSDHLDVLFNHINELYFDMEGANVIEDLDEFKAFVGPALDAYLFDHCFVSMGWHAADPETEDRIEGEIEILEGGCFKWVRPLKSVEQKEAA